MTKRYTSTPLTNLINRFLNFISIIQGILLPQYVTKTIVNFFHIYRRDIWHLFISVKAVSGTRKCIKNNITIVDQFDEIYRKYPNKNCLLFEDTSWKFCDVEDYSNRVSSLFGSYIGKGEVVALMMPNRPEFACIWLGNAKAGIITALINTNLRLKPLLHCLNVTKPKAIIYCKQYESDLAEVLNDLEERPKLYNFEGESKLDGTESFLDSIKYVNPEKRPIRRLNFTDVVLYMFTSGTTGLPKPANISHSKLYGLALATDLTIGLREDDIVYCPLPLYHGACTAAVTGAFVRGFTVALRTKFSASGFFSDCCKYNATAAQYIGEMLRYILNTPPQPGERNHKLRMLTGNGVRAEVWGKFAKRFNIKNIVEYYGSTEGNFLLTNNKNVIGSCGYIPIGIPKWHLIGPSIIKVNPESGEPIRNKDGLCVLTNPGETGLCIGYCPAGNELRKFHGYAIKKETAKKIISNVFKKGDSAFNTGDLMVMDETGWIYFVDRLGDTFRWKGENVSTAEIEEILNEAPNVTSCAVYGVKVGELEGRAGMAAIVIKGSQDLDNFSLFIDKSLPFYARPLFLRIVESLQCTTTFKVIKGELKKEGFDINTVTDPLFVRLNDKYSPITKDIYQDLIEGKLKV